MNRSADLVPAHLGELGPSEWWPYAALAILMVAVAIVLEVRELWLSHARRRAQQKNAAMFGISRQFSSDVDEELGRDVRYLPPEDDQTPTN